MYRFVKRLADFTVALTLSTVVILPASIIAIMVRCEGSPILFKQERPGKGGRPFTIYKFRTMLNETHRDGKKLSDYERKTRLGSFLRKTSLDELPQLYNVLRGEMSLVGPRPLLMEYLPLYSSRQSRRHEALPGITGFAQVNGRNAITWDQKFEYDVIYVEEMSLLVDIKILLKTVWNVLRRQGINSDDDTTMKCFEGNKKQ